MGCVYIMVIRQVYVSASYRPIMNGLSAMNSVEKDSSGFVGGSYGGSSIAGAGFTPPLSYVTVARCT